MCSLALAATMAAATAVALVAELAPTPQGALLLAAAVAVAA